MDRRQVVTVCTMTSASSIGVVQVCIALHKRKIACTTLPPFPTSLSKASKGLGHALRYRRNGSFRIDFGDFNK